MLASPLSEHASLVSVDLPGYGGSDGLPNYGPGQMLNTMESAIKELRLQYGIDESSDNKRGQCIVVGHDWGGIVASRVAAGTEGLIDHLVLVNSLFVGKSLEYPTSRLTVVHSPGMPWTWPKQRSHELASFSEPGLQVSSAWPRKKPLVSSHSWRSLIM